MHTFKVDVQCCRIVADCFWHRKWRVATRRSGFWEGRRSLFKYSVLDSLIEFVIRQKRTFLNYMSRSVLCHSSRTDGVPGHVSCLTETLLFIE